MNRSLLVGLPLLLAPSAARANPSSSGGLGTLACVLIPAMTLLLTSLGGGSDVFRALGVKRWSFVKWSIALIFSGGLAMVSGELGMLLIFFFSLAALGRGVHMAYWRLRSLASADRRPPHLAKASPGPLIAAGVMCLGMTVLLSSVGMEAAIADTGMTKGSLGMIRSGLANYYGDAKDNYPSVLTALTVGKYLAQVPQAKPANFHRPSNAVRYGKVPDDAGGWLYDNI